LIRTFLDSGVLISASRGDQADSEQALRVIESPERKLLTSVFVRLEVYPQVDWRRFPLQRAFLNEFFIDPDLEWASDLNAVTNRALHEAEQYGLLAMDSLQIAAALLLGADEFITTEKIGKPMYRVKTVHVIHLANVDSKRAL
jgi:predicted nucleic acid-binding protein